MTLLKKLTEGIVDRDLSKEGQALRNKWESTGLLEGLKDETQKNGMSVLLENQAKQLLKEASQMATGDVEGFAAVAFPIVRRVFGSLIANDLVAVQPMSLPSGLIFFLDFTHSGGQLGAENGDSLFGGGVIGSQITGGVDLTGDNAERSFYNLNNGMSSGTGSVASVALSACQASGTVGAAGKEALDKLVRFDPDLQGKVVAVFTASVSSLAQLNKSDLVAIQGSSVSGSLVRRLTAKVDADNNIVGGDSFTHLRIVLVSDDGSTDVQMAAVTELTTVEYPKDDGLVPAGVPSGLGAIAGGGSATPVWPLENTEDMPELDIKIDSVAVTAKTKKLKVKWTPELGQDLNAYHNLDAEVELTSIMSEQIALELDREILEDLIKGATASTMYWSRRPGKFLNRLTGLPVEGDQTSSDNLLGADFTGNVSQWYETLLETVNDVSAQIHRKTLRGGANFLVCGPEVAAVLEMTAGFRAKVAPDADSGDAGAVNVGSISKKWDVYVDPYFPRNVILVGRRGAQFLESGYVYAPYVPLQVTPTIFGVEDFVPRKGVMTRYAKKMVRPDMYGLVVIQDLLG
jgi:hypothetical protein